MMILKNVDNFFENRINITGYCVKICFLANFNKPTRFFEILIAFYAISGLRLRMYCG